ncbi:T9SS type B sorting domain-containing protein [Dinghuibacter silviterrae]|uniref:Gliding motility-associated-like protein n=1 Tax=Dinghuibacter silviterrae TaxID=1539049 RepID=A0A4R8DXG3_9BACT|nr:gliding motility-associated C-terminal domain-containing protein [Dinghuibacter silviterrae]TDX02235.1 gliding motility-associated-like protein [Dinghuibacter silviterrae]
MKSSFLVVFLAAALGASAQCGYPAVIKGGCLNKQLVVHTLHALSKIVWYRDGVPVDSVTGKSSYGSARFVVGGDREGAINNQFGGTIESVFVDDTGNVYASDDLNNRVRKWAPGAASGVTVAGGNGQGAAANQLYDPGFLFVDRAGNLFVSDPGNNRVQKWVPGATSGVTVAGGNGPGNGAGQLSSPAGIYVDCEGGVYVADYWNERIQYWAAGATSGVTVVPTQSDTAPPTGLWVDAQHNICVTFGGANYIEKWTSGSTTGVEMFNTDNGRIISHPSAIYVDYYGNMYISDEVRVTKWDPSGHSGSTLPTYTGVPNFSYQYSLSVDCRGNVYTIVDSTEPNYHYCSSIYVLPLVTTIDTSYTPISPGAYYAHVTDVNGFSVNTDTVTVKPPPSVPPSVSIAATSTNVFICEPITFTATPVNAEGKPSFQWQVSGVPVGTDTTVYSNNIFANGDQVYCIMTASDGCGNFTDTSNVLPLKVDPQGHATVTISPSKDPVCAGTLMTFTAAVVNEANTPVFQWLVNGQPTNDTVDSYSSDTLKNNDVVYCLITSDASCGLAKSNSIRATIYPQPSIDTGQVFSVPIGQSLTLTPVTHGDIASYGWSPPTGLSDPYIQNPVASVVKDMVYTLVVVSPEGCADTGAIIVNAFTPLSIPGAFTPNGDGINDIFYVLGGPVGSKIEEFTIFNRWGQEVFHVQGVPPGDPSYGWNGWFQGIPAPVGAYVYFIRMDYVNGVRQAYKGAVTLMR